MLFHLYNSLFSGQPFTVTCCSIFISESEAVSYFISTYFSSETGRYEIRWTSFIFKSSTSDSIVSCRKAWDNASAMYISFPGIYLMSRSFFCNIISNFAGTSCFLEDPLELMVRFNQNFLVVYLVVKLLATMHYSECLFLHLWISLFSSCQWFEAKVNSLLSCTIVAPISLELLVCSNHGKLKLAHCLPLFRVSQNSCFAHIPSATLFTCTAAVSVEMTLLFCSVLFFLLFFFN